jgi:hypothetical protein
MGKVWAATPLKHCIPNSPTVGEPQGECHLGTLVAGGIPCQGLPTLGSCSFSSK